MKIVEALGGNALGKTPEEQLELVKETAKQIVKIVEEGHEVVIIKNGKETVKLIPYKKEEYLSDCLAFSLS